MNKRTIVNWFILFILSLMWGSSFILMKKSLLVFNYIEVSFLRLIIAFFILAPLLVGSLRRVKKKHIIPLLIVSLIGTVVPAILFAKSQVVLDSSVAGMLNALTPIFTLIIGIIFFNVTKWNTNSIIGIIIGLIGTYILLSPSTIGNNNILYSLLIILATICYALSINTIKDKLESLNSLDIAVISSFFSAIIPIIYISNNTTNALINKIYLHFDHFIYLLILGLVCTSLAIILFNILIKRCSALFASSTTYLIPIFAIIWGTIDAEIIQSYELIGITVILTGVFIMNYKRV
jgi:drug/metabolite transporter (DMT)-like permease